MDWGGFVFFLVLAGFTVLVAVGLLRVLYSPVWNKRPNRARYILNERYARGELSSQEYREMLADIEQ